MYTGGLLEWVGNGEYIGVNAAHKGSAPSPLKVKGSLEGSCRQRSP